MSKNDGERKPLLRRKKSRKRRLAERAAKAAPLTERPNNMIVVTKNEMRILHAYGNAMRRPFETEAGAQKAAARLEREHPETEFYVIPLRQAPYMTSRRDEY